MSFVLPLTFKGTCKTPCWFALFSLEKYLKFNSYFSIVFSTYFLPKCHSKAVPVTHLAFSILMFDHEVTMNGAILFSFKDLFNRYLKKKVTRFSEKKWKNYGNMRPLKCSLLLFHLRNIYLLKYIKVGKMGININKMQTLPSKCVV